MKQLSLSIFLFIGTAICFNYQIDAAAIKSDSSILKDWFHAVQNNDIETIKRLSQTIDINVQNPADYNLCALIYAAREGHYNAVEFLLQQPGININVQSKNGMTPLIAAAIKGHDDIVKLLLPVSQINMADANGFTAFAAAALWGKLSTLQLLIAAPGIDIHKRAVRGITPLINAANNGHEQVVKFLLNIPGIGINAESDEGTALMRACLQGHENVVKELLANPEIDVNKPMRGASCIFAAVQGYENNIVKLLLANSAIDLTLKVDNKYTVLGFALINENMGAYTLIKNKIADLTEKAFEAVKSKDLKKLKSIVAQIGIDTITDVNGNTLFDQAFISNCPEIIEYLLLKSNDPRELLSRFPFESIAPTSALFKLCMCLAFGEQLEACSEKSGTTSQIDKITNLCANCSADKCTKKCGRCKKAYYCSAECQKAHWQKHKQDCKAI